MVNAGLDGWMWRKEDEVFTDRRSEVAINVV